ncbi:hypothetical protein Moror_5092 [Moniliophthora roreri MCA 2997]|uniref:Uncharacterized protein n=1 Tax=Moniliophthora roreri (strain MCA 2997) TaxID=1381753 RepID=V2WIZ7_MONRO|nr:hypothetical protein Moror_5092 [Moniliophthora roreri MCA 2997]
MYHNGYGLLAICETIHNFSTNWVNCNHHHYDQDSCLTMTELWHLLCKSQMDIYQPHEEYQQVCPKVLIVCMGGHGNPIPIIMRTPPSIQNDLIEFLKTVDNLLNLTSQQLLHSAAVKTYLQQKLPYINQLTFVDLHVSFTNLDHLQVYIDAAQQDMYPEGTGWNGLLHIKHVQDTELAPNQCYI